MIYLTAILTFLSRFWSQIVIILFMSLPIISLGITNTNLTSQLVEIKASITNMIKEKEELETKKKEEELRIEELHREALKKQGEEYEAQINSLKLIVDNNHTQLNQLYESSQRTSDIIRDTSTPRESLVKIAGNYDKVFRECTAELVTLADYADREVAKSKALRTELQMIYDTPN